jgi:Protein of unknown function (DUF1549)/Protein of unknown function (DUF1553)
MRTLRLTLPTLALLLASLSVARADDLLPPGQPIEKAIDHYIDAQLKADKITPAAQADDANLVRRLTLDLVGRIPTADEARAYVQSKDPEKRRKLIERLMASSGFIRQQAAEFDVLLMGPNSRRSIRDYLTRAFQENRSWDRMFRELMLPDQKDPAQKSASEFLSSRVSDLDRLTAQVSVIFFGVNVSCAQCHDHPKVPDWTQSHFYGMKAFFSRTFDNGGFLAERDNGEVRFKTTRGEERLAKMMFLTGKTVDDPAALRTLSKQEQRKEKEFFESLKRKKTPPPAPKFSARARLVEIALQPGQNEFFARSIVNQLWARFFGYGLVMPLDQMHSASPASHPELLDWLARDLIEHNYDLKRLVRGLVLSQAYSRSSQYEGETPRPYLFAVGQVRPLTPIQLANSLRLATTDPAKLPAKDDEREKQIESLENSARGFARELDYPGEDFQVSVTEALLFSNSDRVQREFLNEGGDRLLSRLKDIKDPRQVVDLAVWNVLSRAPTEEEHRVLGDYFRKRADRHAEATRQILWALMTSSEFRFNY